jgi:hypothetical protein
MAAWRQRVAQDRAELERLREVVTDMEAELEQARESRSTARCQSCGTQLACPACNRGDDYA